MDVAKYRVPGRKGPPCTTGLALATLPHDKRDFLQQLLDDPLVPRQRIADFSEEDFGIRLPASGVTRHCRGECGCA